MATPTARRAALYIRVSSVEQARHGLSLEEQKAALLDYAAKHGMIVADIYADEGTTARKSISRRKELQRLLVDVKANRIDVILFIKLDRWFRNVADYYKVQSVLDAHRVDWIAILEDYNTSTSAGRLNLNIRLSIAQNESDQTADRIKFVFEGKKARHEALTGNPPFGYSIVDKHFTPNEDAPKILDLFRHYAVHQSMLGTLQYAFETYGITWRRISLRRALANPSYIGTFYDIPDYAPAIVPLDLFQRVQKILAAHRYDPQKTTQIFLFSGLIRCPECLHILMGNKGHLYANQTEYKNKYYRCALHSIDKKCTWTGSIFERPLESYLIDHLRAALSDYDLSIKQRRKATGQDNTADKSARIKEKLDRLKDLYVSGFIDRESYAADFKRYNAELTALMTAAPHKQESLRPDLKALLEKPCVKSMYDALSPKGKAEFWHSILEHIDVTHYEKGRNGRKEFKMSFLA